MARLVPDRPRMAVDAFRDFWTDEGINLVAPEDMPAEDVTSLDE